MFFLENLSSKWLIELPEDQQEIVTGGVSLLSELPEAKTNEDSEQNTGENRKEISLPDFAEILSKPLSLLSKVAPNGSIKIPSGANFA